METLTPVQRVAVIAIGLALTLLVAMLLLPWAWKQISEWMPATATRGTSPAPAPLPEFVPPVAYAPLSSVQGTVAWAAGMPERSAWSAGSSRLPVGPG